MLRWIRRLLAGTVLLALALALLAWIGLRSSLPALDGHPSLPGLQGEVRIDRDALGVATLHAGSETDMARALGYLHAQERFFEMDLMRRSSAGELAELFGPLAMDTDRRHRVHRLRARVEQHLGAFAGDRLPVLQAYTEGVNAGLEALPVRPWPYLLLRQRPRRWTVADSALTGHAMYFDLQDAQNARELAMWRLRTRLPPALFDLLAHGGSSWDAPLQGPALGDAVLPSARDLDLRRLPAAPALPTGAARSEHAPGSNNFAVGGALTGDGRAIVADDMHLGLRVPNVWFRARLRYTDARAPGGRVDVSGFTLPGLPAVIVGSNGHVAWGFTNAYADTADWYAVTPCPRGRATASTACEHTVVHRERILVAGAAPVVMEVEEAAAGPVLHRMQDGQALALRWVAHLPGALNLGLADFAHARDLDQLLVLARHTATPAQNLVAADADGHIAWRILGPLPQRPAGCTLDALGAQASVPTGATCPPWPISTSASPELRDPPDQRLWTANARVVDAAALGRIGDSGYALGARAGQIRDGLFARGRVAEADLLAVQLDDRALFLQRWWQLLRDEAARVPAIHGPRSALVRLADASARWEGRASVNSVSYRIVRAWRLAVHRRIADGLTAPARARGEPFDMPALPQLEGVVWPLLQQRPAHLLPRRYACTARAAAMSSGCADAQGWTMLMEEAAREVLDELAADGPLEQRRWGERNTAAICHPLAAALPHLVKPRLCMPADPLPGDSAMPRVQGPAFGASERMVVAPGHETDGILHMPGGQSGHPLSPFWGAGHDDWVHGRATPFLPGQPRHVLRLLPPD